MIYIDTITSLSTLMIGTTFDSTTSDLARKLAVHAENEINKYLSKRYDVSVFMATTTSVPPIIRSWAETLTEGYMYQRMSRGGKESMARGQNLIDQVLKNLLAVEEYQMDLIGSDNLPIQDFSNTAFRILSNTTNYEPTFDEDKELNWKVDPDKLDDIASRRK